MMFSPKTEKVCLSKLYHQQLASSTCHCKRFLKEHTNVKNTSTDDGDKPEKVYKYDDQDGLSDLDNSEESSPCPVRIFDITPPPGVLDVCMLILICV
jgi:hypothetical protein